jgi:hypothetical protein
MGKGANVDDEIGFPEFRQEAVRTLEPLLAATKRFLLIGREVMKAPVTGQWPDLAKQITQSVGNSMEAVLLLASNGYGVDGLRVARTMFEAAVVLHYIDSHQELVQDFIDYRWVIRKKHNDYLLTLPHGKVPPREEVAEVESNYDRVKSRFVGPKGHARDSWCKARLRQMANEVKAESIYSGFYPFASSMTHTDILAVTAGASGADGVVPATSMDNVTLGLQTAAMSFGMALTAFDEIAGLGRCDEIEAAFTEFKDANPVTDGK